MAAFGSFLVKIGNFYPLNIYETFVHPTMGGEMVKPVKPITVYVSSWLFQPFWKIFFRLDHLPRYRIKTQIV